MTAITPFRHSRFTPRCVICEAAATVVCPRCMRPHCPEHATPGTRCCPDCRQGLLAETRRCLRLFLYIYGPAVGLLVLMLVLAAPAEMAAPLVAILIAIALPVLAAVWMTWRKARRGWIRIDDERQVVQ